MVQFLWTYEQAASSDGQALAVCLHGLVLNYAFTHCMKDFNVTVEACILLLVGGAMTMLNFDMCSLQVIKYVTVNFTNFL